MVFEKVVDFVKNFTKRDEVEDLPDDVTKDKYLRSLRRERRMQLEEVEKLELKKQIEAFKKEKERKFLWGVNENTYSPQQKPKNILQGNSGLMRRGRL